MRRRGKVFEEIRHNIAQESLGGVKTGYLARKYDVHPESVRKWTRDYKESIGVENLQTVDERISDAKRLEELETSYARALKLLGEKELEIEILRDLSKKPNPVLMKNSTLHKRSLSRDIQ
jgi:transposase-like protein